MSENREDPAMLDRALVQMAQETPEMPADFHERWTSAVRAEAAKKQPTDGKTATAGGRKESRRQWRYILSAAAVFVFLIGGTLLTRTVNKNDRSDSTAGRVPATATEQIQAPEMFAANGTVFVYEETAPEAVPEPAAEEKAAKYSMDMDAGVFMEEAEVLNEYVQEAAGAAMEETADAPAMTAAGAAEEPAEQFFDEAAEAPPEEEREGEPARESEFVSFLKDLGMFTLKTLAVAAAAAVLALGAAAVHKARKKRKPT